MAKVTPKSLNVWSEVLSEPNVWRSLENIAVVRDMTLRQIQTIVAHMPGEQIVMDGGRSVMFHGTSEEADEVMMGGIHMMTGVPLEVLWEMKRMMEEGTTLAALREVLGRSPNETINISLYIRDACIDKKAKPSRYYIDHEKWIENRKTKGCVFGHVDRWRRS